MWYNCTWLYRIVWAKSSFSYNLKKVRSEVYVLHQLSCNSLGVIKPLSIFQMNSHLLYLLDSSDWKETQIYARRPHCCLCNGKPGSESPRLVCLQFVGWKMQHLRACWHIWTISRSCNIQRWYTHLMSSSVAKVVLSNFCVNLPFSGCLLRYKRQPSPLVSVCLGNYLVKPFVAYIVLKTWYVQIKITTTRTLNYVRYHFICRSLFNLGSGISAEIILSMTIVLIFVHSQISKCACGRPLFYHSALCKYST